MMRGPPARTHSPYTTLFRSRSVPTMCRPPNDSSALPQSGQVSGSALNIFLQDGHFCSALRTSSPSFLQEPSYFWMTLDRKSTRLNSSHLVISYAVFCFKKKQ